MQGLEPERQAIEMIVRRMMTMLRTHEAPGSCSLAPLRWELTRRLFSYLSAEATLVRGRYQPADALLERYRTHFKTWPGDRIAGEWETYRRHANTLLVQILDHCATERAAAGVHRVQ